MEIYEKFRGHVEKIHRKLGCYIENILSKLKKKYRKTFRNFLENLNYILAHDIG